MKKATMEKQITMVTATQENMQMEKKCTHE